MIKSQKINVMLSAFVFLFFLLALIPVAARESKVTIIGVVEGLEFDDDNNVIEVGIVVPEEREEVIEYEQYLVLKKGKGLQLLELVGETVEVTGNLSVDPEGNNTIEVLKFEIINPPDLNEDIPDLDEDMEN